MNAIVDQPSNRNFLAPINFQFQLKRAPTVTFFIQKINLPQISLMPIMKGSEYIPIPYAGEQLTYSPLTLEFKVDEDLINYLEIHNWLTGLGRPETYDQYKVLSDQPGYTGDGVYSDISLLIYNNNKNPNYEVTYKDAFPVRLSGINFNTTSTDIKYATSTVDFKYTNYEIVSL